MSLQVGLLCLAVVGLSTALICPDGSACEHGNTCCESPTGGYGCCPLPNEGVKAVICPDQSSECPDDTTCCQLPDGSWGCCPLAKAVCCEDKQHCCPEGTQCDLVHSKCVSALESFPMLEKLPARKRENQSPAATCPGGKSSCPAGTTCCLLTSGDYGCCPYPEAVCCSDHLHCCPGNTTCDLEHEMCKSGNSPQVPLGKKFPSMTNDVVCPDKLSSCPDETTCCLTASGTYGCCPMPNAVCCTDLLHCCPSGTKCDLTHSTCVSDPLKTIAATKIAAGPATAPTETAPTAIQSTVGDVPCNASVACADGSTCCKSAQGTWVCCPLPEAVCCEDHLHCCPHGTVCNLKASTCDSSSSGAAVPWHSKVPSFPMATPPPGDNNKCDTTTYCPGKTTCCQTPTGDWACCPLHQAVCCEDHIHCCPHGTVCNLEAETCDDPSDPLSPSSSSLPWVLKVSALSVQQQQQQDAVTCDQQSTCPGGTTCCKQTSGEWACCPLPKAVCCTDQEHCCPEGYQCNLVQQTCDKPSALLSLPWFQKIPIMQRTPTTTAAAAARSVGRENMCDPHVSCPRDTTCCFMHKTSKWGCCPLRKAICCPDGDHCCPSGYTCNTKHSSCTKGLLHAIPWFTKQAALSVRTTTTALGDVKCDDQTSCASGTTCCKLTTGDWGCCPLVKAVCCADHEHCCPQGYTCNMQTQTCDKQAHDGLAVHTVPLTRVVAVAVVVPTPRGTAPNTRDVDAPCDDTGNYRCSLQETCCKTSDAQWACCPSPKATCCADLKHCCPTGYSCDVQSGGCTQRSPLAWDTSFSQRDRDSVPFGG